MICYEVTLTLAIFTVMLASKATSLAALTGTPLVLAPLAAIALAAVVLVANLVIPVQKHRLLLSRLRRRVRQEQNPQ